MTNAKITQQEFDLLRSYISSQCGITLGDDKKYLIETRLEPFLEKHSAASYGELHQKLLRGDARLRDEIIDAMTTNETYWFRDTNTWTEFRDNVIPELVERAAESPQQPVRIWSAACSTGQEPYSLAMLIDDYLRKHPYKGVPSTRFEIIGTDISPTAIATASAGQYDSISMGRGFVESWASFKNVYTRTEGRSSTVIPEIRRRVQFRRLNLRDSFAELGRFDLVLLRNVAIYFADDFKRDLYDRIADSLKPDGMLVMGNAESVSGYTSRFNRVMRDRTMHFRRAA